MGQTPSQNRGLCVVDLSDPETCSLNQKAHFTLVLKFVQLLATEQRAFSHTMVIFISHL